METPYRDFPSVSQDEDRTEKQAALAFLIVIANSRWPPRSVVCGFIVLCLISYGF
jgi:hypothetical protein